MKRLFNVKKYFTLIEITVAMSIFAILMLVMMQVFGSLQNVWRRTNARITTTEDARLIMRIIKNVLEQPAYTSTENNNLCSFYYNDNIANNSPESPILWIATSKQFGRLSKPLEFAIYSVEQPASSGGSHKLYQLFAFFTEEKDNPSTPDTPAVWDFKTNQNAYKTYAQDSSNPKQKILLLENIVDFTVVPVPTTAISPRTPSKTLPARYRILVKILNDPTTASIYEKNGEESLLRTFTLVVENKITTD